MLLSLGTGQILSHHRSTAYPEDGFNRMQPDGSQQVRRAEEH